MGKVENDVDFDAKPLTIADVQEQTRIYMERMTTNKVLLAGSVRGKRATEPKLKYKRGADGKYTDEVVVDENGVPQYWGSKYYVVLAFEGGEIDLLVDEKWYDALNIGNRVLFEGAKGTKFGNVQDIYHSYIIL
ncbi:MAG: hypothetical protein PHQ93_06135 [Sulfurimonas sp.]|uniref:hypothetical protein n=1 Tax=Sulfurimonas sp. TaxID=2022749 RepID=UPI002612FD39|nr:hypothetical protein [Sulfurimonas sp.]MDD5400744.1 hypothetical protein [Sulfurimonas sp.]